MTTITLKRTDFDLATLHETWAGLLPDESLFERVRIELGQAQIWFKDAPRAGVTDSVGFYSERTGGNLINKGAFARSVNLGRGDSICVHVHWDSW